MNKHEMVNGYKVVEEVKAVTGKDKVVVFPPFIPQQKTWATLLLMVLVEVSYLNDVIKICKELREDYAVIVMSEFLVTIEENPKLPTQFPKYLM